MQLLLSELKSVMQKYNAVSSLLSTSNQLKSLCLVWGDVRFMSPAGNMNALGTWSNADQSIDRAPIMQRTTKLNLDLACLRSLLLFLLFGSF